MPYAPNVIRLAVLIGLFLLCRFRTRTAEGLSHFIQQAEDEAGEFHGIHNVIEVAPQVLGRLQGAGFAADGVLDIGVGVANLPFGEGVERLSLCGYESYVTQLAEPDKAKMEKSKRHRWLSL
jgi:hypothetical protein